MFYGEEAEIVVWIGLLINTVPAISACYQPLKRPVQCVIHHMLLLFCFFHSLSQTGTCVVSRQAGEDGRVVGSGRWSGDLGQVKETDGCIYNVIACISGNNQQLVYISKGACLPSLSPGTNELIVICTLPVCGLNSKAYVICHTHSEVSGQFAGSKS